MKLKRKLVSALSAIVLGVPTLGSVVSCTFTRVPEDEYKVPEVSFNGSTDISPDEGITSATIKGFKFSRNLYDGEEVKPIITLLGNDSKHDIKLTPNYKAGKNTMTIDASMSVSSQGQEQYTNIKQKFNISFQFTYNGEVKGEPVLLKETFTFNYMAKWQNISILGDVKDKYTTNSSEEKIFTVSELSLSRELRTGSDYEEELTITSSNDNIDVLPTTTVTGTALSIDLQVVDCDQYEQYDETFNLVFTFSYHKKVRQELTQSIYVQYNRDWQPNSLKLSPDSNGIFGAEKGSTTFTATSGTFILDRTLKTKYDETLEVNANNVLFYVDGQKVETYDASEDFILTLTTDDTKFPIIGFELKVNEDDKYKKVEVIFDIDWEINDIVFVGEASGTIKNLKFVYTPEIEPNSVITEGFETLSTNILTTAKGESSYTITSCEQGQSPKTQNFHLKHLLDPRMELIISAIPVSGTSLTNPITVSAPSYVNHVTGVDEVQYINFSISFSNIPDTTETLEQEFKLQYTFKVDEDVVSETPSAETFKLIYTPAEKPAPDSPYTVTLYDPDPDSINHGDTIIYVTGKLNKNLAPTDTIDTVIIDPNVTEKRTIEFIKGEETGHFKDGYYIHGTTVEMYVKIVDPEIVFHVGKTYTPTFEFTFKKTTGEAYKPVSTTANIPYVPFNTTIEAYTKARTIPMNIKYEYEEEDGSTGYNRVFTTAWILAKAPNEKTKKVEINDYNYYIAVTLEFTEIFDLWCSTYSDETNFGFGITDDTFKSKYQYNQNDSSDFRSKKVDWYACDYNKDYVYCNTKSLTWENDPTTFQWQDDQQKYGADIYVAKVNFSELMYLDEQEGEISDAKIIAYVNKLNTLNNYYSTYHHINNLWFAETTDSDPSPIKNDDMSNFDGFGIGGFPWQQHYYSSNYGSYWERMSRSFWKFYSISNTGLKYQSSSEYRQSGRGKDEEIAEGVKRGAPVYYPTTSWDKEFGYINSSNYEGDEAIYGSMLAARSTGLDEFGKQRIYLIGIYRNSYDDENYSSKRIPYFDSFIDDTAVEGKKNLLAKYWNNEWSE